MFNFFSEIKKELKLPTFEGGYNLVNVDGRVVYVEGHRGLVSLADEKVMFKVKDKIITVTGKELKLKILSSVTLSITGEIESINLN